MRIAIVGLGLIGTSIALAMRRAHPEATILGIDRADVLRHPRIIETFTAATVSLPSVAATDLIILATPVEGILDLLPVLAQVAPSVQVTDTGSTKRLVIRAARDAGLASFVGGHPMAGSDRTGPDAARADLFDARPWFLIGDTEHAGAVGAFVRMLGATPLYLSDDGGTHDRVMAAVSHLPQVVVSALMARVGETVGREGLHYAGSGLRDTTRLAGSEASVWESVLATNADAIRPLLLELAADLQQLAGQLTESAAVRRVFGLANMYRREL